MNVTQALVLKLTSEIAAYAKILKREGSRAQFSILLQFATHYCADYLRAAVVRTRVVSYMHTHGGGVWKMKEKEVW